MLAESGKISKGFTGFTVKYRGTGIEEWFMAQNPTEKTVFRLPVVIIVQVHMEELWS